MNGAHIYRINIYPNSAGEPTPAASLYKVGEMKLAYIS